MDLTEVDLLPVEDVIPGGFKASVVQLTCSGDKMVLSYEGSTEYDRFDQVSHDFKKTIIWKVTQDYTFDFSQSAGFDLCIIFDFGVTKKQTGSGILRCSALMINYTGC